MTARHQLSKLIRRDGAFCHYCEKPLVRHAATRDHVVPKALGGENSLDNYVLACQDCNGERGTDLYWCSCDFCGPLIEAYRTSDAFYEKQFSRLIQFNKAVVRKRSGGYWKVYLHGNIHSFKKFEDALAFATTYERRSHDQTDTAARNQR